MIAEDQVWLKVFKCIDVFQPSINYKMLEVYVVFSQLPCCKFSVSCYIFEMEDPVILCHIDVLCSFSNCGTIISKAKIKRNPKNQKRGLRGYRHSCLFDVVVNRIECRKKPTTAVDTPVEKVSGSVTSCLKPLYEKK